MGSDRSLGSVELSAGDYVHEMESGEFEIDDEKQPVSSPLRIGSGPFKGNINYTVAFYPTVPVVNPEEEAEEEEEEAGEEDTNGEPGSPTISRKSTDSKVRPSHSKSLSTDSKVSKATNGTTANGEESGKASLEGSRPTTAKDSEAMSVRSIKEVPKTFISLEDLHNYGMCASRLV